MFNQPVGNLPFCDGEASDVFKEIVSTETYGTLPDKTVVATMRALLYPRLVGNKEHVTIYYKHNTLSERDMRTIAAWKNNDVFRYIFGSSRAMTAEGSKLHIADFSYRDAYDQLDYLIEKYSDFLGAATRLKDVEAYIKQQCKSEVRIYVNESRKSASIFLKKTTFPIFHVLQAFIPKYLPWLFEDAPINDKEQALLKSLTERYSPKYTRLLSELYEQVDIKTIMLEKYLRGFNSTYTEKNLRQVRDKITELEDYIADHQRKLAQYCEQLHAMMVTQSGLELELQTGTCEADQVLIDYFTTNKAVTLVRTDNGAMEFYICGTIETFHINNLRNVRDWANSWYNIADLPHGANLTRKQMHRLIDAIFEEKRFKVRVCAGYFADPMHYNNYIPIKNYEFPQSVLETHTPNPHMNRCQCLGQYEGRARDLLKDKDWFGLLEMLSGITKGLNFADTPVSETFIEQLYVTDSKCIQTPDKQLLTPLEAYKIVEAEDKAKEEVKKNEQTD